MVRALEKRGNGVTSRSSRGYKYGVMAVRGERQAGAGFSKYFASCNCVIYD